MASYVWSAAVAGNWSTGSNWSVGGVAQSVPPTNVDDVFFGTGTGATNSNCTVDVASLCANFDATGYTGTLTLTAGITFKPSAGGTIKFVSTMTIAGSASLAVSCQTGANATLTCGTKTLTGVNFTGVSGGGVVFGDTFRASGTITHTIGTLDTGSQACTWGVFACSNVNNRTLALGTSAITITGSGGGTILWNTGTTSGLIMTGSSATVTFSGAQGTAPTQQQITNAGGVGVDMPAIVLTGSGVWNINSAGILKSITRTGTAAKTEAIVLNTNLTLTDLNIAGNSQPNSMAFRSSGAGTTRTVTVTNAPTLSNIDFMDITAAGTGGTWAGTNLGDAWGNTNITFPAQQTYFLIGTGARTVSTTTTWSLSSGGASAGVCPMPHDNVVFDANSGTGTLTNDRPTPWRDLNAANSGAITPSLSVATTMGGSFTLGAGFGAWANSVTLGGRGTHTITTAGIQITPAGSFSIVAPGGTYTLQDNLTTGGLVINTGTTFNANGKNVNTGTSTARAVTATGTATWPVTINMGTGTWTLAGDGSGSSGFVWNMVSNVTVNPSSSLIIISDTTAVAKSFGGLAKNYNNLQINGAVSAAAVTVTGANTFNTITGQANAHLTLPSSTTTTISSLSSLGSAGNLFVLDASIAGTAATLSSANRISTDFISVKDSTAANNTPFYAGANGTLVSGTTNWLASAPPASTGGTGLLLTGVG